MTADWELATSVLRLSAQLIDGIQAGLARRGFDDVRPAHGFAFARLSIGPATTGQLAEHLGVTKQAGSELVSHLVDRGYLSRQPDPDDRRARRLVLTERGVACTRAAQESAAETVTQWRTSLTPEQAAALADILPLLAQPGRLRPVW